MSITPGDRLTLSQDAENPENWYLNKDRSGFELRPGYKNRGYMFNHRNLVTIFCEAMSKDQAKTHNFKIAGQPTLVKGDKAQVKYWGILIS